MVLLVCGLVMEIRAELDHSLLSRWSQVQYIKSELIADSLSEDMEDKSAALCLRAFALISMATQLFWVCNAYMC